MHTSFAILALMGAFAFTAATPLQTRQYYSCETTADCLAHGGFAVCRTDEDGSKHCYGVGR